MTSKADDLGTRAVLAGGFPGFPSRLPEGELVEEHLALAGREPAGQARALLPSRLKRAFALLQPS